MKSISKFIKSAILPFLTVGMFVVPANAQSGAQENTLQLQSALRRIARNSNDSSALADAGLAALKMGDTRAAIGFLAKADQLYPKSGRVKVGLAKALLQEENPFGAIRYFDEAVANGISAREIAVDRGLAYDLIGRNQEAQADYKLALQYRSSDVILSRYAVSLGISGDIDEAEKQLNPLLQRSDRDAWRNRAFIFAMNGKKDDANKIARQTMQRNMAKAIKPFFERMPKLTAAQKAAAVHFGHFPASENIGVDVASVQYAANTAVRGGTGADAGLIPLGQPLGENIDKPRVLAMPDTSERRRPGKIRIEKSTSQKASTSRRDRSNQLSQRLVRSPKPTKRVVKRAKPAAKPPEATAEESKTVQLAAVDPKKILPKAPEPKNRSASAVRPGFETPVGSSIRSVAVNASKVTTAINEPLVSETITRKVDIGTATRRPANGASPPAPKPSAGETAAAIKGPVRPISFDLAQSSTAKQSKKPQSVETASMGADRRSLADIMKTISIPEAEKKIDVVPVDLEKITPAKPAPTPKRKTTKAESRKSEPKIEKHPKRYWVQIATGSNKKALAYDYRRIAKKNTGIFKGKSGWTSPWGKTRRLVVGPFSDMGAAKKFEAGFRKGGGDGFAWVSAKGTEVNKLAK